jgi:cytochrome c biogenesis protein CcmG, thiol:disulfide interchange protein DsbE
MARLVTLLGLAALVAVVVIGLSQTGEKAEPSGPAFDLSEAQRDLRGAPSQLAGLHAQAAELLDGGKPAFERRLRALRGHPVVVNKWASWCGPCRSEFPYFQRESARLGKEVAFLGLNSRDEDPAARRFLAEYPVPFPSYADPEEEIARAYKAANYYPMTIFIDARGEVVFVHPGEYKSGADLAADIERYL